MIFQEFISKIDIREIELPKAVHYCELKGIELHNAIFEYLQSFKSDKVSYTEIATAYRYDKRIRKILYKYIGLLEEYIRAFISNKYSDSIDEIEWTEVIKKRLNKKEKLFYILDNLLFNDLINQVLLLSDDDKKNLFPNTIYYENNLKAIVTLRNAVSHNRFLLSYLDFKECNIDNQKRSSLYANLQNFSFHLKDEIKNKFIKEIKLCSINDEDNVLENQTKWQLLENIIINLDNNVENFILKGY
jgi:hypothetical protein